MSWVLWLVSIAVAGPFDGLDRCVDQPQDCDWDGLSARSLRLLAPSACAAGDEQACERVASLPDVEHDLALGCMEEASPGLCRLLPEGHPLLHVAHMRLCLDGDEAACDAARRYVGLPPGARVVAYHPPRNSADRLVFDGSSIRWLAGELHSRARDCHERAEAGAWAPGRLVARISYNAVVGCSYADDQQVADWTWRLGGPGEVVELDVAHTADRVVLVDRAQQAHLLVDGQEQDGLEWPTGVQRASFAKPDGSVVALRRADGIQLASDEGLVSLALSGTDFGDLARTAVAVGGGRAVVVGNGKIGWFQRATGARRVVGQGAFRSVDAAALDSTGRYLALAGGFGLVAFDLDGSAAEPLQFAELTLPPTLPRPAPQLSVTGAEVVRVFDPRGVVLAEVPVRDDQVQLPSSVRADEVWLQAVGEGTSSPRRWADSLAEKRLIARPVAERTYRVVDVDGEPIEGAHLWSVGRFAWDDAVSDAAGEVTLRFGPSADRVVVWTADRRGDVFPADSDTLMLTAPAERAPALPRVVDGGVPRANVALVGGALVPAPAFPNGALPLLADERLYPWDVSGRGPEPVRMGAADVELPSGVVNLSVSPAERGLRARRADGFIFTAPEALNGRVPVGDYVFHVVSETKAFRGRASVQAAAPVRPVLHEVPVTTLRGRVLDVEGQPAAGALVVAPRWHIDGGERVQVGTAVATADAAGRFELPGMAGSTWLLRAVIPDWIDGYDRHQRAGSTLVRAGSTGPLRVQLGSFGNQSVPWGGDALEVAEVDGTVGLRVVDAAALALDGLNDGDLLVSMRGEPVARWLDEGERGPDFHGLLFASPSLPVTVLGANGRRRELVVSLLDPADDAP